MSVFRFYLVLQVLFVLNEGFSQDMNREELIYLTASYTGDRYENGRPKIPSDLLKRAERISIDVAWQILDNEGYKAQYEGNWETLNSEVIVGRAVTAMYLPSRPDVEKQILSRGHKNGRIGNSNSWPIEQLEKDDVYVADAFGKTIGGTLIGDNLANAIYGKTGKGVIFYGASRDKEGLAMIEGFNAYVKNWNPTFLKNVMLGGLNTPIHIGDAIVMPGDLVLAKADGVVFIPAHLAEKVIETAEFIELRDAFGHTMLREGVYSSGEIDNEWTAAIKEHFLKWIKQERFNASLSIEQIEQFMEHRTW
ncbi:demethylmenaquinone methyltransferase [Leeuwenhoekiella aestuarii]|uniref:Demethylmenaquinone methyltransferase n=2 Tax=Leeuwenhoekiella aestuarii TaxID=2249426 RepID=A0A4Q0P079_9FLAO|nr:RraA family protein [Leeuwenhoekiella aestuarii]RXG18381.1 demethylmenaquinone methyltransferase [Leeuwenhoekiella aestuarii]RXG19686.1 demethylmenaquinone methyltransferase [Leeuwenhoekiella aestuarii]